MYFVSWNKLLEEFLQQLETIAVEVAKEDMVLLPCACTRPMK